MHTFFLGGKYPRRDESLAALRALEGAAPRALSVTRLAESAGLNESRAKVIVAQLVGAELAVRTTRGVRLGRAPGSAAELEAVLSAYEARHDGDREKLEAVMRYAQSTRCRMRSLRAYFGEPEGGDGGHCDNCRDRAAEPVAPTNLAPTAGPEALWPEGERPAEPGVAVGDRVRHRRFGAGHVVRIDEFGHVTVAFVQGGERMIASSFLRKVA